MQPLKPPVRWLQVYWDEGDEMYFFEADADGWVWRQVVLSGPDRTPITAAAHAELPDVARDGFEPMRAYEARYGVLAEHPITEWDRDVPGVEIERATFEDAWTRARAYLER